MEREVRDRSVHPQCVPTHEKDGHTVCNGLLPAG